MRAKRQEVAVFLVGAWAGVLAGCATGGAQNKNADQPITRIEMDEMRIEATRQGQGKDGDVKVEAYDAADLFERASTAHGQGKLDDAEQNYLRLLGTFPTSSQAKAALYNLALVHQDQRRWDDAIVRFKQFSERYPDGTDAKDALFQLGSTYAEAERWIDSEAVFEGALKRDDLTPDDKVEAMARRGFARMSQGDLGGGEALLRNVFAYKSELDANREARLETDYYLAFAQLQLASIAHKQANAALLRWPEAQMNKDLDEKARLLLLARRRYIDAVRYGNARVASMAAFQIGALFQEFHDAVLGVPPPPELGGTGKLEQRTVYMDELRKKLRVVLEKSLRGHQHNLELFERLGVETEWVKKSRDAIDRLQRLLTPELPLDLANPQATPGGPMPPQPELESPDGAPKAPRTPEPDAVDPGQQPEPGVERKIL
jgi:tetratricopeptide (TPR) repeat protein